MPKRIGRLFEKASSLNNCRLAVYEGTRSLKKTKEVKQARANVDKYAGDMVVALMSTWRPGPVKFRVIKEGTRKKERELVYSDLFDHLIHTAIIRVLSPYLMKRFDKNSCGSIPGRGQAHAMNIIKEWIRKDHYEYALECDVYHFYASLSPDVVMRCLGEITKDKKFLKLNRKVLDQMQGANCEVINRANRPFDNEGIAIGFSPSHWYGNLALTKCDRMIRENFKDVDFVRYMDNYVCVCNDKATLHRLKLALDESLDSLGLRLKDDWQVFPIKSRPIRFLSYRYHYSGEVEIRKELMYRITRKAKKTAKKPHVFNTRSMISYMGVLKHADAYNTFSDRIAPYVSPKHLRGYISYVDRKDALRRSARTI